MVLTAGVLGSRMTAFVANASNGEIRLESRTR
jgi:hypothetical protein